MNTSTGGPTIGVALGSGAARGWSHIGVLKALLRSGIEPDVVCGTSVGAMIGAAYAADNLEKLEHWVLNSTRSDVFGFFSIRMPHTAFVDTQRFEDFLDQYVAGDHMSIESLPNPYAAVCTNLEDGREIWLRKGRLAHAVKASMAMPGLFPAVADGDKWLVDGGLVNPVPVSTCRTLGADIVIGVNLNADILHRRNPQPQTNNEPTSSASTRKGVLDNLKKQVQGVSDALFPDDGDNDKLPGLFYSISKSINIFQDQITRRRLDADPADVIIEPRVADIGLLEFSRAGDAIKEGDARLMAALPGIQRLIKARRPD
ncbi:MAG: patatin-like phospholipase family protein [Gammaproteobacteria bacterium]|nr:patatin-like phospholipase family protein [Gammaproteobacteria bacterium]